MKQPRHLTTQTLIAPPTKIGKYEVLNELGRGDLGLVYLGNDPFLQRKVAIKVARPDRLGDAELGSKYKRLLLNEVRMVGKLIHPHIVEIFDAAADDTSGYLVMEYVAGGTVQQYTEPDSLLPVEQVIEIIFKTCNALDYANKMGLIHRDIKPTNLLVVEGTEIKISDFGAAYWFDSTQTQIADVGSPAYMPPEQFKRHPPTHLTDIYSVGVMMFELLTGRLPFETDNYATLAYVKLYQDPPSLATCRQGLPEALEPIVQKAMNRDIEQRYQSWSEFTNDLNLICKTLEAHTQQVFETERFEVLKKLPFFSTFTEVELWETLRISDWRRFPARTQLVKEGATGKSFFILAEGEVTVTKGGKHLANLPAGACFGEMAYLDDHEPVRSATVISNCSILLMKLRAEALHHASERLQARFNKVFLKIMIERLRLTDQKMMQAG